MHGHGLREGHGDASCGTQGEGQKKEEGGGGIGHHVGMSI